WYSGDMTGSLQLHDYPGDIVGLSWQYRKQTLIERYGADIRLPDLREEIAQCERRGQNARRYPYDWGAKRGRRNASNGDPSRRLFGGIGDGVGSHRVNKASTRTFLRGVRDPT